MMAGGRLEVSRPLITGRTYERTTGLVSAEAKTGRTGQMLFVKIRHTIGTDGQTWVTEEEDAVYRQQLPGEQSRAFARPTQTEPVLSPDAVAFQTDPVTLFRFSALTYNAHRIHYDQSYATQVEGYPDLVVHGPLLALMMLELPRRQRRDKQLKHFGYRLLSPAFCGSTVTVGADTTADGWALHVDAANSTSATGTASFESSP